MASMDEYKYRENLETQLKCTLVQVIICTDTSDLFMLGELLVRKAPFLQQLLTRSEPDEEQGASPAPSHARPADPDDLEQASAVDTRKQHKALCKLLFLYQHQVLYAAVAKIQSEEERAEPGAVVPALFGMYCNLATVCTSDNSSGGEPAEIVSANTLEAFQAAIKKSGISEVHGNVVQ